jgi:hypothetical protein
MCAPRALGSVPSRVFMLYRGDNRIQTYATENHTWWVSSEVLASHRAPIALRVPLGVIFFAHGAQKMFGWFWRLRLGWNDAVLHSLASHSGSACSGRDSGRAFERSCLVE